MIDLPAAIHRCVFAPQFTGDEVAVLRVRSPDSHGAELVHGEWLPVAAYPLLAVKRRSTTIASDGDRN
jgi:hypothetical protein